MKAMIKRIIHFALEFCHFLFRFLLALIVIDKLATINPSAPIWVKIVIMVGAIVWVVYPLKEEILEDLGVKSK